MNIFGQSSLIVYRARTEALQAKLGIHHMPEEPNTARCGVIFNPSIQEAERSKFHTREHIVRLYLPTQKTQPQYVLDS